MSAEAAAPAPAVIDRCPACGFRFRGRPDDYLRPTRLARRLEWSAYLAPLPALAAVAVFFKLTADPTGKPLQIPGLANMVMLFICTPSLVLYAVSRFIPRRLDYLCPQCGWTSTATGSAPITGKTPDPS